MHEFSNDDTLQPRSQRRLPQYSLRTIIAIVLLISLPLGWLASVRYAYRSEWHHELGAMSRLENRGVMFIYGTAEAEATARESWLDRFTGNRHLKAISYLYVRDPCDDAAFNDICTLSTLPIDTIRVEAQSVTEQGLERLKCLPQLRFLRVACSSGAIRKWHFLTELASLETLVIDDATESANIIRYLPECDALECNRRSAGGVA